MMMQEEQRNRKEKRRRHPVRAQAKSQNRKTVLRYGGAALHGRLSMAGNNRPFPLCAHLEFLQTDLGMSADLIENPSAQKVKKAASRWEWQACRLSRSYGQDSPDRKNPAVHISSRCQSRALTTRLDCVLAAVRGSCCAGIWLKREKSQRSSGEPACTALFLMSYSPS